MSHPTLRDSRQQQAQRRNEKPAAGNTRRGKKSERAAGPLAERGSSSTVGAERTAAPAARAQWPHQATSVHHHI